MTRCSGVIVVLAIVCCLSSVAVARKGRINTEVLVKSEPSSVLITANGEGKSVQAVLDTAGVTTVKVPTDKAATINMEGEDGAVVWFDTEDIYADLLKVNSSQIGVGTKQTLDESQLQMVNDILRQDVECTEYFTEPVSIIGASNGNGVFNCIDARKVKVYLEGDNNTITFLPWIKTDTLQLEISGSSNTIVVIGAFIKLIKVDSTGDDNVVFYNKDGGPCKPAPGTDSDVCQDITDYQYLIPTLYAGQITFAKEVTPPAPAPAPVTDALKEVPIPAPAPVPEPVPEPVPVPPPVPAPPAPETKPELPALQSTSSLDEAVRQGGDCAVYYTNDVGFTATEAGKTYNWRCINAPSLSLTLSGEDITVNLDETVTVSGDVTVNVSGERCTVNIKGKVGKVNANVNSEYSFIHVPAGTSCAPTNGKPWNPCKTL